MTRQEADAALEDAVVEDAALVELRHELDARASHDEEFWLVQRQGIQRRLRAETRAAADRRAWRPAWAFAGLVTAALVLLMLAPGLVSPGLVPEAGRTIDPATAELLRSVEITLASDVAPSLSAGELLLAELEAGFAFSQIGPQP